MATTRDWSMPSRISQQQQPHQRHPLVFLSEEIETADLDIPNDNDKLLLPRSTRTLKRRSSLFEKSRDWVIILVDIRDFYSAYVVDQFRRHVV
jgi:hypothetical protein